MSPELGYASNFLPFGINKCADEPHVLWYIKNFDRLERTEPDSVRDAVTRSKLACSAWVDQNEYRQSYNVAPTYAQPVVRIDADNGDQLILQSMKWGLVPSWTKNIPDYQTLIKTINCRDDSLIEGKPMFNSIKSRRRCIVVAQGFYEWLKPQQGGKGRTPHFTKRKDGQVMLFAGLYDVCSIEGKPPLYTYTIITTSSSRFLAFLHDRMPVILENGSDDVKTWLDPNVPWSPEVAKLLRPYEGELECYPVTSEVGKVGNNSPDFIIPLSENKSSITNFFTRPTTPHPKESRIEKPTSPTKRSRSASLSDDDDDTLSSPPPSPSKKQATQPISSPKLRTPLSSPAKAKKQLTPKKATKKGSKAEGSAKITSFFGKTE